MKNKFVLIRYVLMLWLLCGVSYTQSIASTYDRTSPSASWGYQPLHSVASSMNYSVYGGTAPGTSTTKGTYSASSIHSGISSRPTYRFQSTSTLINSMNMADLRMMDRSGNSLLLSGEDDDEDFPGIGGGDNPIGTIGEQPVGEPLVLLFFALAFLGFRFYRRRNA